MDTPAQYYPRLETALTCSVLTALCGGAALAGVAAAGADPPPSWGLVTWWMMLGATAGTLLPWVTGMGKRVVSRRVRHVPEPRLSGEDRKQMVKCACTGAVACAGLAVVIEGGMQAIWVWGPEKVVETVEWSRRGLQSLLVAGGVGVGNGGTTAAMYARWTRAWDTRAEDGEVRRRWSERDA